MGCFPNSQSKTPEAVVTQTKEIVDKKQNEDHDQASGEQSTKKENSAASSKEQNQPSEDQNQNNKQPEQNDASASSSPPEQSSQEKAQLPQAQHESDPQHIDTSEQKKPPPPPSSHEEVKIAEKNPPSSHEEVMIEEKNEPIVDPNKQATEIQKAELDNQEGQQQDQKVLKQVEPEKQLSEIQCDQKPTQITNNEKAEWNQNAQQLQQEQKQLQVNDKMKQVLKEQTTYLFRDFQNFLGIAYETQAVLDRFKDDPDHQMVKVNLNRLSCQSNISNSLQVALTSENESDTKNQGALQKNKDSVNGLLRQYLSNFKNCNQLDERILKIIDAHVDNSLYQKPVIKHHSIQQIQEIAAGKDSFSSQVAQKLISAIIIENQFDYQSYQIPTAEEIDAQAKSRYEIATQKTYLQWFSGQLITNLAKDVQFIKVLISDRAKGNLQEYFKNLEAHFKNFNNEEYYRQTYRKLIEIQLAQTKQILVRFFTQLINSNLDGMEIYSLQALYALKSGKLPIQETSEEDFKKQFL